MNSVTLDEIRTWFADARAPWRGEPVTNKENPHTIHVNVETAASSNYSVDIGRLFMTMPADRFVFAFSGLDWWRHAGVHEVTIWIKNG